MAVTLSETARNIVRVQFSGKDFDTYVDELNQFLEAAFGTELYNDFTATDVGQMMLEAVAYSLSTLSWYLDRQGSECFLETAELTENVARLTRLVGYKPSGAVPATGAVEIELSSPQVFPVDVDRGTQLSGEGGVVYETNETLSFAAGETGPKEVGVTQVETRESVFVSDGSANQEYELSNVPDGSYIAQASVEVRVDGVLWDVVDFISFDKTNQCETSLTLDPPIARFGDGIAGNIPQDGVEIRFTYMATLGVAGSARSNTITTFRLPIIENFTVVPATVTNPEPTGVGSDPESISESKANAPLVYRTSDRAVTEEDYTSLIEAFADPTYGAVAVGRAIISRSLIDDAETLSILADLEAQYGSVAPDLYSRLETHWGEVLSSACKANLVSAQVLQRDASGRLISPNPGLAQALKSYLEERKEVTQTVSVTDGSVNLSSVNTTVSVKVLSGYNRNTVTADVKDAVDAHLIAKKFGESVYRSQVDDIIMNVSGVDYANVVFTDPSAKVDSNGNVIIETYEVVTLGTTIVSVIE